HYLLSVDVGAVVGGEEQRRAGDLLRLSTARQRVQLTDAVLGAALAGALIDHARHAGLDQARPDRVHPYAGAVELIGAGLHQVDDARLRGRVGDAAGPGADAGHRGGADDRALALRAHH